MTMMMMMMAHQKQTGDSVERQDIDKAKKKEVGIIKQTCSICRAHMLLQGCDFCCIKLEFFP